MERIWQPEGASFQEGTVSMLTESRRDAAASRGGRWVGDTPSAFFAMQRAVGNQAVQHIMAALRRSERGPSTIPDAEPHDEQRVVQAKCACGGSCSTCQGQESPEHITALSRKASGKPLASAVQADMEEQLGANFSNVRVHSDVHAREATQQLHANALTMGQDIFFNAGQYEPTSYRGRRILAHELAHVVQQARGWRPARTTITLGEPDDRYEREADRVAERVAQRPPMSLSAGWHGQRQAGEPLAIQERWRGPDTLVSRAAPPAAGQGVARMPTTGLTTVQIACIKRIYEKAMGMPKDGKWQRCYVTAQAATCGLPRFLNAAAVQAALHEAIAPVDWELYLTDPKGLACQAQGGQTPEACCEETRPRPEPQRRAASRPPSR